MISDNKKMILEALVKINYHEKVKSLQPLMLEYYTLEQIGMSHDEIIIQLRELHMPDQLKPSYTTHFQHYINVLKN